MILCDVGGVQAQEFGRGDNLDRGPGMVAGVAGYEDSYLIVQRTLPLQRRGSLVVAVPEAGPPVMRAADVDKTIRELRDGSVSRNR